MRLDKLSVVEDGIVTVPGPLNSTQGPGPAVTPVRSGPAASRIGTRRCPRCGAVLRRGNDGDLCAPCSRVAAAVTPSLPPDFYKSPDVVVALENHDFGWFFKTARAELGMTQEQFGVLVGLAQSRVCKIENGAARLRDFET